MSDRIVYLVVSEPGGVDGLDQTDKGGTVLLATYQKEAALSCKGQDCRKRLEPTVVNVEEVRAEVMRKLTAIERLVVFPEYDAKQTRQASPPNPR